MQGAWEEIVAVDTSAMSADELLDWTEGQRRFLFDGEDVRKTFVQEFESFLFSCEWTDSEVVKEIVGYLQEGIPLNQIGDRVGLKVSAFRMRMSRMTDTINSLLFDGQACPEGIYSLADLPALKKCLLKLRLVRDPVNLHDEFSLRELNWIKGHISEVSDPVVDSSNMAKYFKSVLYLALVSRSFVLSLLDDIDPVALAYAFNDMQSDGVNSTKLLFSMLLRRLSSDSVACEREMAQAKHEYQEYMKS